MNYKKKRQWLVRPSQLDAEFVEAVTSRFGLSPKSAELLYARGCRTVEDAACFIEKELPEHRDPMMMADMPAAVARIERAFADPGEVIAIYGDYDVDGVTSVSLLYLYLTSRGCRVGYYIPSRSEEGYGVNRNAIDKLKEKGVTLMITVDTGITATDEVEYAKSLGIDVIVTDHHECHQDLPLAAAVVNPHRSDCPYPFKEFAGVGVTFKLICALERSRAAACGEDPDEAEHRMLLEYADLVAIGTIADVMPLTDENRMIVTYGLASIENVGRTGIRALMEAASRSKAGSAQSVKRDINANYIGFAIAPRLNAAGRMGSAAVAVELLLSDNKADADRIADELCEINKLRQSVENKIAQEAFAQIEERDGYSDEDCVIVLSADHWHQGIIGIVASKVSEKFGLPAILVTFDGNAVPGDPSPMDVGKGSGRSVKGLNLVSALVECDELLNRYGGHELAAGLSVTRENLPLFRKKINEYAREQLRHTDLSVTMEADAEIEPEEITLDFARELASLIEPCGVGNNTPVFVMRECAVVSIRPVGAGKHLKIVLAKNGIKFSAMFFGTGIADVAVTLGDTVDVLFTVGINTYAGETTVQLLLNDIRFSSRVLEERRTMVRKTEEILAGGSFRASEDFLPERRDFVNLYTLISDMLSRGDSVFSDSGMMTLIRNRLPDRERINYVKYKLLVAIFDELGILGIRTEKITSLEDSSEWLLPEDSTSFEKIKHKQKVDLESSALLQSLRGRCVKD